MIDIRLSSHVKTITAVDFSPVMAARARKLTASCKNVRIVNCDAVFLPFKERVFSKVVIYAVAQYLNTGQIENMLRGVQAATKPGGLILLGGIPRIRNQRLPGRIRDIWIHQGFKGILRKSRDYLMERWLRFTGRITKQYLRPASPPIRLHSESELQNLADRLGLPGQILPQNKKMPWFHQTFDLLLTNSYAGKSSKQ